MPLTLHVDPTKDLVFIDATGMLASEDVQEILDNLHAAGPEIKGRNGIIDSSRAVGTSLNFDTVRRISERVTSIEDVFRGTRWAIVAPSDVMFGIARIYETLRAGSSFEVRTFRTVVDAEAWLRASRSEK